MSKLSTLSAVKIDDKALNAVAGGIFDRSTIKHGPSYVVRTGAINGNGNTVSGRDTNFYGQ